MTTPASTDGVRLALLANRFEGIARSSRHKSGIAVRFPRMLRRRLDKPVAEADTLETLQQLLPAGAAIPRPGQAIVPNDNTEETP